MQRRTAGTAVGCTTLLCAAVLVGQNAVASHPLVLTRGGLSASAQGTSATAWTTLTANRSVTAEVAGICARSAGNANVDFPFRMNVKLSRTAVSIRHSRALAAGTYTYWACARVGGRWYDVGQRKTITVAATQAPAVTPSPTASPSTPPSTPTATPQPSATTPAPTYAGRSAMSGIAVPTHALSGSDAQLAQRLDLVKNTGVGWIRVDVVASEWEHRPGVTDWTVLDRIVAGADARGLRVLGILNTVPSWARPSGTAWNHGPTTTSQRAAYVDFARRAAERYKSRMDAWEIWNEPNLDQFWAPQPNVGAYGALIRDAYPVVKAANPALPVLAGGTGWSGGGADINSDTWYTGLYNGGFGRYFDAANVHPYQDIGWTRGGQPFTGGEMGRTATIRSIMNSHGDSAKPIWGTEVGFPTAGGGNITETEQGRWIAPLYDGWIQQNTARGRTGPLFYYTLLDYGPDREGSFGIVRVDGTQKPAYPALRSWVTAGS